MQLQQKGDSFSFRFLEIIPFFLNILEIRRSTLLKFDLLKYYLTAILIK